VTKDFSLTSSPMLWITRPKEFEELINWHWRFRSACTRAISSERLRVYVLFLLFFFFFFLIGCVVSVSISSIVTSNVSAIFEYKVSPTR
jgi:hypothetical protein